MVFIKIYFVFFKIGLFTIGGGLAALPLLQNEALNRGWVSEALFVDMIAVSQSTPGPIGINMATYVGFNQLGVLGSIVATLGMVTPSIIIICLISKFLKHFNDHKIVKGIFVGLRPAVTGIIAAAVFNISLISMFDIDDYKLSKSFMDLLNIKAIGMFVIFMFVTNKWKRHPIYYILIAGVVGSFMF